MNVQSQSIANCAPIKARRWNPQFFTLAFEIRKQRRILAALGDQELRDIGISRADAEHEARRSFWDID